MKPGYKPNPVIEAAGKTYISNLSTYLFWREKLDHFKRVEEKTGQRFPDLAEYLTATTGDAGAACPLCQGRMVWMGESENVRCLCALLNFIQVIQARFQEIRGYVEPASFSQVQVWGKTTDERDSLRKAVTAVRNFLEDPRKWLVICGGYGCGKTLLLSVLAHEFGPFAVFLSSGDFERVIFRAMDNRSLPEVMWAIERAPILLFDDWGAEYGSDLVKAKFRQVVSFRYSFYPEYPIAMTTNLTPRFAYQVYDGRAASRLYDKKRAVVVMIKAGDYRMRGG